MPAKPGCGATTTATYATAMASQMTQEPTLLLDFDVRLGVTSFLLKAEGIHTIVDALLQTEQLDQDLWSSLVARLGNLHLLGSGPVDFSRHVPTDRYAALLDFAVRHYSLVSVDLPGTMEDCEAETLMRSKRIFLVCTPDIGALHVARRKATWLQDLRLTDKVAVVLNCVDRRTALSMDDIQRIIQLPIRYMLPANTGEIARAVQKGAVLDSSSGLGKHIARIAAELTAGRPMSKKPNAVRRFVEYFSISAARDAR
jgi:Flp pilus assembly CpaE family ATPase